jgi:outer membrane receptor protein involved in Fe transport
MVRLLLAGTVMSGLIGIAEPAFAQDAPPPATPNPPDTATGNQPETTTPVEGQTTVPSTSATGETVRAPQDIVITGTRIPQPNLTSASPVTVLTSQEVKLSGTTRTEDLINSLPQSFAAQGSNISNGASGIATVNLRGLGPQRTLVLINGRRLQAGDPRTPVADINFIPSSMIKRVDVLTGGASSVYGADAVAGVVNFIMDTNFRGLRLDGQASTFWHSNHGSDEILAANAARGFRPPRGDSVNGGAQDISAAFGAGFDDNRGSIMAYATYRKQDSVLQSTRDYSFCGFTANSPANVAALGRKMNCGGSATSNIATIFTSGASGTTTFFVTGTTPQNQGLEAGFVPFNFGPYNYYQRPDERYTFGAFAEYEIAPGAKPYLEAMFMNDRSDALIAPSGDFANTGSVNCDNPLLSAAQLAIICGPGNTFVDPNGVLRGVAYVGRRNVEGGGRDDDQEHTAWRIVGGVRGDLLRGLSYDAYYQFGTTHLTHVHTNDFSTRRLNQAIDVVTDPATGLPVCRGTLNGTADVGCVPYNPFSTAPGAITPEALAFLQVPGMDRGNVNETVANANATFEGGEYGIQTPWSDRGVALNVGGEYRKESLEFLPDLEEQTGDLTGNGGPTVPVNGKFDVRELFTEVQIPIVSHSFIEEFTITGGFRYSDYKVAGHHFSTNTYKVSAELAPIRDVRFRASYNRAVRAPNVVELFAPQAVGLEGTIDPCAGAAPAATLAQCQLTGVSATQFGHVPANPAGQYSGFLGGNPQLAPEKADSYTVGVVLQPRFVPGLAVTVDYFDINVKGLIGVIGFNTIMTQCIQTGDPFFCSKIHRNINNGNLWLPVTNLANGGFITDLGTNVGGVHTRGVDVNGSYSRRLGGMGTLNLSMVGTYLKDLIINPFGDIKFNCAGFYGLQCTGTAPNPKWRHKFRVSFTLPNGLGISGQWRYISAVKDDTLSSDPNLQDNGPNHARPLDEKLNARSYFDLALTARLADRYNFRMGVNNLLDRDPPLAGTNASGPYGARSAPPYGNGNTFPQTYDALGRYMFAGVTIDF